MSQTIVEWFLLNVPGAKERVQDILGIVPDPGIKKYVALLTQTGTNDPVATVLENTLGEVPVWTREDQGEYRATIGNPLFTLTKTWVVIGDVDFALSYKTMADRLSDTQIFVGTINTSADDGVLAATAFEIRVYS